MKFSESKTLIFIIKLIFIGLIANWFKRITFIPTYWPGILLLLLYTAHKNARAFRHVLFVTPVAVGLMLWVYWLLGHYNNVPETYLYPFGPMTEVYPFIISALVLLNIEFSADSKKVIFEIGRFAFYCFLIALSLSFITEFMFPGASRMHDLSTIPKPFWKMEFGMLYALPFVSIMVISALHGFYKHIISVGLLIFSAFSGFLTLSVFMMIGIYISYYESISKAAKRLFLFFAFVFGFGVYTLGVSSIGVSILSVLPNEVFAAKAEKLEEVENSQEGDVEDLRGDVYSLSLGSFYKFPLFGTGDYSESKIGYHSFWLDKLGFIGLFGTIPYLLILIAFYRYLKKRYFVNDKVWLKLNILLFCLLILNPFQFWSFWSIIYIIVPVIRFGIPYKFLNSYTSRSK